jgi:hypothetical protein
MDNWSDLLLHEARAWNATDASVTHSSWGQTSTSVIRSTRQPLYGPSKHGHPDIVVELLKHGDVVEVDPEDGYGATALMLASKRGHTDIVVELLRTRQGGCKSFQRHLR